VAIPAGLFVGNKILRISADMYQTDGGGGTQHCDYSIAYGTGSASTTIAYGITSANNGNGIISFGTMKSDIYPVDTTTTANQGFRSFSTQMDDTVPGSFGNNLVSTLSIAPLYGSSNYLGSGYSSVNTANISYISFNAKTVGATTCFIPGGSVEILAQ